MHKLVFNTHCGSNFLCHAIVYTAKCNGESGIPDKWQQPKLIERLVLWYEFDCDGKFSHVKLLIKEKYAHTIITERYRFCCFKCEWSCLILIDSVLELSCPFCIHFVHFILQKLPRVYKKNELRYIYFFY